MTILLSIAAAITYGGADFIGGLMTKRTSVYSVVLLSQLLGSAAMVTTLPFFPGSFVWSAVGWGALAGIGGALGVTFLYRGLARGTMSVVAPVTAVEAAAIPVVFGLATGEAPGTLALGGIVVALVAVMLVSRAPTGAFGPTASSLRDRGLTDAFLAGACFAIFFIFLDVAGADNGLWPLVGARAASCVLVAIVALALGGPLRPARGTLAGISAAGVLDASANVLYLVALRTGLLSLVAVIVSLYPASTVVLARAVLGERLARSQLVGIALAGAGVAFMALG